MLPVIPFLSVTGCDGEIEPGATIVAGNVNERSSRIRFVQAAGTEVQLKIPVEITRSRPYQEKGAELAYSVYLKPDQNSTELFEFVFLDGSWKHSAAFNGDAQVTYSPPVELIWCSADVAVMNNNDSSLCSSDDEAPIVSASYDVSIESTTQSQTGEAEAVNALSAVQRYDADGDALDNLSELNVGTDLATVDDLNLLSAPVVLTDDSPMLIVACENWDGEGGVAYGRTGSLSNIVVAPQPLDLMIDVRIAPIGETESVCIFVDLNDTAGNIEPRLNDAAFQFIANAPRFTTTVPVNTTALVTIVGSNGNLGEPVDVSVSTVNLAAPDETDPSTDPDKTNPPVPTEAGIVQLIYVDPDVMRTSVDLTQDNNPENPLFLPASEDGFCNGSLEVVVTPDAFTEQNAEVTLFWEIRDIGDVIIDEIESADDLINPDGLFTSSAVLTSVSSSVLFVLSPESPTAFELGTVFEIQVEGNVVERSKSQLVLCVEPEQLGL